MRINFIRADFKFIIQLIISIYEFHPTIIGPSSANRFSISRQKRERAISRHVAAAAAAAAAMAASGWFFVAVYLRASVGVSATAEYQLTGSVCVDKRGSVRVTENPSSSGPSRPDRPRSPLKYTLFDRYPSRGTMRLVGGVERCRLKGYR